MGYWNYNNWDIEPKHESEYEKWIHLENYVRDSNEKYCKDEDENMRKIMINEKEVEEELKQLEKYKTKYENLESKIGCSPEVFFKLHRYRRIFDLHDNCYYNITNITDLYIETECEREGFKGIYFLAEYMGSWCLKEDRSE